MPDYSYIGEMLGILGATGTLIIPGLPALNWNGQAVGENGASTTVTAVKNASGLSAVATYAPGSRKAFTKSTYYKGRGAIPLVRLNGTTEYLTIPDEAYWEANNNPTTNTDVAFSYLVWFIQNSSGRQMLFSKSLAQSTNGEYQLEIQTDASAEARLRDFSAAVSAVLITPASKVIYGRLMSVGFTYNGIGGATAVSAGNAEIFTNGVQESAPTRTNSASYVAMENLTHAVRVGSSGDAGGFAFLNGAVSLVVFERAAWTAAQVTRLHAIGREALTPLPLARFAGRR